MKKIEAKYISLEERLSYKFVRLTEAASFKVYEFNGENIYGFEDTFIVKCPVTVDQRVKHANYLNQNKERIIYSNIYS